MASGPSSCPSPSFCRRQAHEIGFMRPSHALLTAVQLACTSKRKEGQVQLLMRLSLMLREQMPPCKDMGPDCTAGSYLDARGVGIQGGLSNGFQGSGGWAGRVHNLCRQTIKGLSSVSLHSFLARCYMTQVGLHANFS